MNRFEIFCYNLYIFYIICIGTIILKFLEINLFFAHAFNEIAHYLLNLSGEMIDWGIYILKENKYFKLFK